MFQLMTLDIIRLLCELSRSIQWTDSEDYYAKCHEQTSHNNSVINLLNILS